MTESGGHRTFDSKVVMLNGARALPKILTFSSAPKPLAYAMQLLRAMHHPMDQHLPVRVVAVKPKVFIGSSREGVKIADAIHYNLTNDAECTVWKDGVFQLSSNTLSALIDALRLADFGVFVFSPDDMTIMRNVSSNTVRDNVLFELGLFIGRLGQERCYFLIPDAGLELRLPSDLAGVTPGRYESGRSDNNWVAALNPACMQIKMQMARLESFQDAILPNLTSKIKDKPVESSPLSLPEGAFNIQAKYFKKGILVTGDTLQVKERLEKIGSWNRTLSGWMVPGSREKVLREKFPNIIIHPAEEA